MIKKITQSPQDTERLGELLGAALTGGEVIALFGGLGAGKTAFTRGVARGMGLNTNEVSSPTFAIVHEHPGKIPLYHFDMYRVESLGDLYSTGYYDYLDSGGALCIEWSENIEQELGGDAIRITLEYGQTDTQRVLTMCAPGEGNKYENTWA